MTEYVVNCPEQVIVDDWLAVYDDTGLLKRRISLCLLCCIVTESVTCLEVE